MGVFQANTCLGHALLEVGYQTVGSGCTTAEMAPWSSTLVLRRQSRRVISGGSSDQSALTRERRRGGRSSPGRLVIQHNQYSRPVDCCQPIWTAGEPPGTRGDRDTRHGHFRAVTTAPMAPEIRCTLANAGPYSRSGAESPSSRHDYETSFPLHRSQRKTRSAHE